MSVNAPIGTGKASRCLGVVVLLVASLAHAAPTRPPTGKPSRIVSLAPSTTEILFAVGAGSRVVAVTRYCDYPPEVSRLPKLGGVLDLNLEAVLAAKPELVVAIKTSGAEQQLKRLEGMGVRVLVVPSDALADFAPAVSAIAAASGNDEGGRAVIRAFDSGMQAARQRAGARKRTLILVAEHPLVAAGPGSFIDGAVATIGLVNVLDHGPFPEVGREQMLERNPELVLDLTEVGVGAVGRARLVRLKDPRLVRLSPRLPDALQELARTIGLP